MASASDSKKRLALAIIDFLSTSLKDGTLTSEDAESIEVAQSCIADTFHVDPSDKAAMQDAIGGQSLLSIYGVYEKLKGKSSGSAAATSSTSGAGSSTSGAAKAGNTDPSQGGTGAEAEAFKSKGNSAMAAKDYKSAIELYSKALNLSPLNPIYLSNRAAAYSASHQHAEASTDAEMAVAANPKYTKAWSRLGLARFAMGDAKGSMEAYQKGIEFEGNGGSDAMKRGYETAKKRVEEEKDATHEDEADDVESARGGAGGPGGMPDLSSLAGMFGGGGGGAGGGGGMPDLSALAGMMGGGGRGGGRGGMPDLSSIMSNPMFANMAQNLMSNPDMMNNLMSNPRLRQMAERFGGGGGGGAAAEGEGGGGGGGGVPDIASLMQDPSIAEMISAGAKSKVKSSVQRAIRTKIIETYPLLAPHIDELIPKKSQLDLLKLPDRVTLYALDNQPLFWQHMDDPIIPHLRVVHAFPKCFSSLGIDRGAIRFVLSGATLMAPGLTSTGGRLPDEDAQLKEGDVAVVEAEGKEEACLVGQLRMGTEEVKEKKKGVVIDMGHYLGDGLWNMTID
ncbi:hypothetical protein MMC32_005399 [Xylographa parallela]|nr:hypothetical protein [Xylographa parallela]